MSDDLITSYARSMVGVAEAEGAVSVMEAEMAQIAAAFNASEELRAALADANLPAARRQQVAEDLLGGQASRVTTALVSMVIASGRAGDLGRIADRIVRMGAEQRGHELAEVRSAVPLDADQQQRLASALSKATGKDIELKVVIDPSVLGGVVTQIGDQIIDGSVRTRLHQLREAF
ncbi:MAG: ATP synthase F1 subunit delta [Acidimicrobiales bacterium]